MRKTLLCTPVGLLALMFALTLSAKASVNYSADQAASCPPTVADTTDDGSTPAEPPATTTTPAQSPSTPIKSGRSNRPKWKALLPGAIR